MNGAFLQSSEWERIHAQMGRKTWRVQGFLIVRYDMPRGFNYLYCARPEFGAVPVKEFLEEVKKIARDQQSLFLKIDPAQPLSFGGLHIRAEVSQPLQPQQTIIVDVSKSEEDLLAAMYEKTRYNIRLAERKDVEVIQVIRREIKDDFEIFWKLLTETTEREGFHLHEKKHYELLLHTRSADMSNELFFAHVRNDHDTILATAMINFYRDPHTGVSAATYLHGGSSREHKEAMAPYLLHWRIMQEAKKRGMTSYDLWGIDEKRWPGVTRFKKGFGGSLVEYPQSVNVIYRPVWYVVYRLMRKRRA